ncbi:MULTISPECIES: ClpXP protease specificity-enhancing factor [Vitreoscilla]|uniref:ClpXP protease specificity-enhancing factor n=1 Tax=Vitreoscilla stercoraria TaxID=61 RepID=A0ABY4E8U2_VITST|nr:MULTISPECIES: ClpXP protease specificity-enhancing factor [Vitreoscilla]AUZ03901.1 stringent starvation protein B [Vitreoscilla sp. C1]UOO92176.1 ClpXP protease specificity-enhancing factor [Vitreoscilla stercoraria]
MTTSTKPYLVRALYDWCVDNGFTPHIAVWVNHYTQVPRQFVQDEQIILNISPSACKGLLIDNEWIHFEARFGGKAEDIWIPVGHVLGIFARENNAGMGFDVEAYEPEEAQQPTEETTPEMALLSKSEHAEVTDAPHEDTEKPASSFLKIVK